MAAVNCLLIKINSGVQYIALSLEYDEAIHYIISDGGADVACHGGDCRC